MNETTEKNTVVRTFPITDNDEDFRKVAGVRYEMQRRGFDLTTSYTFATDIKIETVPKILERSFELARLLTPWTGRLTVHVVPFTAIQEELRRSCPEELFTVLMRRFMMRIAQEVANRCGAKALVTGECLGQVASQTMEALRCTGAVVDLPVLRPCIGMDKEEIVQIARKIGTFETSILPYEDCCTVFTPRHPRLRPMPGEVEAAEQTLDIDAMVKAAVDGIERVQVNL